MMVSKTVVFLANMGRQNTQGLFVDSHPLLKQSRYVVRLDFRHGLSLALSPAGARVVASLIPVNREIEVRESLCHSRIQPNILTS
jgi:hypothetical protein